MSRGDGVSVWWFFLPEWVWRRVMLRRLGRAALIGALRRRTTEQLDEPKIVCSACRLGARVVCAPRHSDCLAFEVAARGGRSDFDFDEYEQGFVDQFMRFYTRAEAWKVAKKNGQIVRRVGGDEGELYSENLY